MTLNFSTLINKTITGLGFRLESGPNAFVEIEKRKVACAPGLRFTDDLGVSTSRRAGWLLSYVIVRKNKDNYLYLD